MYVIWREKEEQLTPVPASVPPTCTSLSSSTSPFQAAPYFAGSHIERFQTNTNDERSSGRRRATHLDFDDVDVLFWQCCHRNSEPVACRDRSSILSKSAPKSRHKRSSFGGGVYMRAGTASRLADDALVAGLQGHVARALLLHIRPMLCMSSGGLIR